MCDGEDVEGDERKNISSYKKGEAAQRSLVQHKNVHRGLGDACPFDLGLEFGKYWGNDVGNQTEAVAEMVVCAVCALWGLCRTQLESETAFLSSLCRRQLCARCAL